MDRSASRVDRRMLACCVPVDDIGIRSELLERRPVSVDASISLRGR
jgi:hypothetical protein